MKPPEPAAKDRTPPQETWATWLHGHNLANLFDVAKGANPQFLRLEWKPTDQDREAAWKLYTELRTRIATAPLPLRSGDDATALASIHSLFGFTRTIIKRYVHCTHFANLAIWVLNERVRPFTADWHKKQVDGRLSSADERYKFRQKLNELQSDLREFSRLLGLLAGDSGLPSPEVQPRAAAFANSGSFAFGIETGTLPGDLAREIGDINDKEKQEVMSRRSTAGPPNRQDHQDAVGLAISGGGIRSATFALGVVQTLARQGIFQQVDFLSTVSGGGYLGCFISSFLNSNRPEVKLAPWKGNQPFGTVDDLESLGVRHLRNHSKYLTEGGVKATATMICLVIYGILASLLLVAPVVLGATLVTRAFFAEAFTHVRSSFFPPSLFTKYLLYLFAGAVILLPLAQKRKVTPKIRTFWAPFCVLLASVSALLLVAEGLPFVLGWLDHVGGVWHSMALLAALMVIFGALGIHWGPSTTVGGVMLSLFAIAGPLLLVLSYFGMIEIFILKTSAPSALWLCAWFAGALIYAGFLNINFASPHVFYRNRLARTYLSRLDATGKLGIQDPQSLSGMNEFKKAPYHLINAAVNLPGSVDPNLRGRNADFFLFSKHFCGSPTTGFLPTRQWEDLDAHLDMGTAMAISGAAAAPHMGTLTSWRYTFLLAMLNVRLSYWIRRPGRSPWPLAGLINFGKELTGQIGAKWNYLNLSDGGHIENLGIYELLRRQCRFIIAIDAEADPRRSFGGLLKMTQFATIDLGVKIEPSLADLRVGQDGNGPAHFVLAKIEYPPHTPGPDQKIGLLLYIKSSLTGNEPEFLKKYHAENPDFPHQSTANQLYSETQFEAYRALGKHVADDLFREILVGTWNTNRKVSDWFESLERHLLEE